MKSIHAAKHAQTQQFNAQSSDNAVRNTSDGRQNKDARQAKRDAQRDRCRDRRTECEAEPMVFWDGESARLNTRSSPRHGGRIVFADLGNGELRNFSRSSQCR
jgi:hypothetical protein